MNRLQTGERARLAMAVLELPGSVGNLLVDSACSFSLSIRPSAVLILTE